MTLKSWLAAFFPAALLISIGALVLTGHFLSAVGVLYLAPVLAYRLLVVLYPLDRGLSNLKERRFSPWWASHQIQLVYEAVPVLEAVLRMIPGVYSVWLRLWGSKIGSSVYWTPRMEVHDRGLLDIGSGVVFGHKVELYGHTVMPKRSRLLLYTAPIAVGDGAFVGAGSRLAPGVAVEPGAVVPILTDLYMNARFPKEDDARRAPDPA